MASDPLSAAYTWSQIWGCSFHKPAIMLRHKSRWPPKPCLEFASYKHHEDILSVIFLRHYFAMAWPLGINRNKRADLNRHIKSNMLQLIQIVFVDGDWIIVCYPSNLLKSTSVLVNKNLKEKFRCFEDLNIDIIRNTGLNDALLLCNRGQIWNTDLEQKETGYSQSILRVTGTAAQLFLYCSLKGNRKY